MLPILFAWLFLITSVYALYLKPKLPLEDDFYNAPENIQNYSEGDIIRWRNAPLMVRSVYFPINVRHAWQFLVRSTDSRGNATAIVTTVLEPYNANASRLLSYQFAEDSASQNCAPSYSMLFGAKMDTVVLQAEMLLLTVGLSRGWYVVAPDYEGQVGSFTAGRLAGHSTLDSIRAVLTTENITGIDSDAKVAIWGYSGGTIASGWAAQLQPKYAPDLKNNLIGVAMGGWVTNITLTAMVTDMTVFAGLIPSAINGLVHEFPHLHEIVYDSLRKDRREWFFLAGGMCVLPAVLKYAYHNFFTGPRAYFPKGWKLFQRDEVKTVVNYNTVALIEEDGVPEIPMFVFHGTEDEIVPFSGAQRAYDNYCDWGISSFEFAVSNSSGHILEVAEGSGAAIKWISDRFEGKEVVEGCKKTVRLTNLEYPGADLSYFEIVKTLLTSLPGGKLGDSYARNVTTLNQFENTYEWVIGKLAKIGPVSLRKREQ